jgi:hypothetical protein
MAVVFAPRGQMSGVRCDQLFAAATGSGSCFGHQADKTLAYYPFSS